jgi:ribosomal protein S12 methylthiotransferase accessory factor
MELTIRFSGNKRVDAHLKNFVIKTDQSVDAGGDASAPEPFSLFLASIGTCAGIYVVYFCETRKIPTDGIELVQKVDFDPAPPHKLQKVSLEIHVPPSFPEKYRDALARAASSCAVKKVILDPPEFDIHTVVD